jgi:hypothetical protein
LDARHIQLNGVAAPDVDLRSLPHYFGRLYFSVSVLPGRRVASRLGTNCPLRESRTTVIGFAFSAI